VTPYPMTSRPSLAAQLLDLARAGRAARVEEPLDLARSTLRAEREAELVKRATRGVARAAMTAHAVWVALYVRAARS
jgi:hypothetical protein